MAARTAPKRRTWPLWLLGLAMLLLVLSILLMQRSYRHQLDASMAQLQHSVAVARLQQQRLAAKLNDRPQPSPVAAGQAAPLETGPANGARAAETTAADEAATLADRLQQVAAELELLARNGATTASSQVEWLDWSRVRIEVWSISRALRQYRPAATAPGRSGTDKASLRDWVSRAQSAANQQRPAALVTALREILHELVELDRSDPNADRIVRRTARLSAVLGAPGVSAVDSGRLGALARETSAIAQRVLTLAPDSVADRMTPR